MATVVFTKNLERHVACPPAAVTGATAAAVLAQVFAANPRLRGYVLADQGALRRHMSIFVDGAQLVGRDHLSDPVRPASEIYVMQALSGG